MEDIAAAAERILSNPEFARVVREMGGGDGGDLMSRLPDVMATLGPLLNSVRASGEDLGSGSGTETDGPGPGRTEEEDPAVSSREKDGESGPMPAVIGKKPFRKTDAERLFLALRPYLGERRQIMLDRCVSVMQMSDLLKAVGAAGSERRES